MRESCLKEEAKMGYLQKLIRVLSTCRHYLEAATMKLGRAGTGLFSFVFSFAGCIFKNIIRILTNLSKLNCYRFQGFLILRLLHFPLFSLRPRLPASLVLLQQ